MRVVCGVRAVPFVRVARWSPHELATLLSVTTTAIGGGSGGGVVSGGGSVVSGGWGFDTDTDFESHGASYRLVPS